MIELREVLKARADWAGWGWHDCDDGSVELENWSPAGENIIVTLDGKDIVREMGRYSAGFDVDEHVEPLVEIRGTRGVPDSITVLVQDALEIEKMLDDLDGYFQLVEQDFPNDQLREVSREEAAAIIETREPRGLFLCEVTPATGEVDESDILAAMKQFSYSDLTGCRFQALKTTDRRRVYAEDYYGDGSWWEVGTVKDRAPVYGLREVAA